MHITVLMCLLWSFLVATSSEYDTYVDTLVEESSASVKKDEVIAGSYWSLGDTTIAGVVKGSVYILGGMVEITGAVQGDVLVIAGSVTVLGEIAGNLRVLAGEAVIDGVIGGKVTFLGANLLMPYRAVVGKDLFAMAGNIALENTVEGDVTVIAASLSIEGNMKQNVHTFVNHLRITDSAYIAGNVTYRSEHNLSVQEGAHIMGQIVHKDSILHDTQVVQFFERATFSVEIIKWLVKFFYSLLIGIVLIRFFSRRVANVIVALRLRFISCLICGVAVLISLPVIITTLLITVIGIPFALTLLALNIISFYTVIVFPVLASANWLCRRWKWQENTTTNLCIGLVVYYLITQIPSVGFIVACCAVVLGFGASVIAQVER